MRRTRKSKGGYPFVGPSFNINTWGKSNYYSNNVNPHIILHPSKQVGGTRRKTKRTKKRRYTGGDDRFNMFAPLNTWYNQGANFIRMTQGKELQPIGNVLNQPIGKVLNQHY